MLLLHILQDAKLPPLARLIAFSPPSEDVLRGSSDVVQHPVSCTRERPFFDEVLCGFKPHQQFADLGPGEDQIRLLGISAAMAEPPALFLLTDILECLYHTRKGSPRELRKADVQPSSDLLLLTSRHFCCPEDFLVDGNCALWYLPTLTTRP
jgi:hypothetical protein